MKLLLLGGTADAKRLARGLSLQGIDLVYSIAGKVRQPQLDCPVVSGGFSQYGGLEAFVGSHGIDAILDATHPYAVQMSNIAVAVAAACDIPVWRYQRPPWLAQPGDDWHEFDDWEVLVNDIASCRSVFFTAGQLPSELLARLDTGGGQRQLLRTATRPERELPTSMHWIEDIGPFTLEAERELFRQYAIDGLVSKNSGGDATVAKLQVARELGVPVLLLRRPGLSAVGNEFGDVDRCLDFVVNQMTATA